MSISVTGYTEAKIEGKWYCIDFFQYDMNGHVHHIPCIEGQSIVHTALQWDCDMDCIGVPTDLSPQVKAECTDRDGKLFGEDDPHQFLAGHIIHFPLPSADPSILSTTNGAGPLVGGTDGYIIIEHAFYFNTYRPSGTNLKLCSVYYRCVAQSSETMRRQYDYRKSREAHAPRPHVKRSQLMFCRLHSSCDATPLLLMKISWVF